MKRAYLGLLLLFLCVFVACGGGTNNGGYPSPSPQPSATPSPSPSGSPTMMNTVQIRIIIEGDEKASPTITFEPNPATVGLGQQVIFEVENRSTNPATDGMTVLLDGFQNGGPTGPRLFGAGVWNNTFVMHDVDPTASEESNPVRAGDGEYSYGAVLFEKDSGNKIGEDRRPQIIVGNMMANKPSRSASPAASPSPSPSATKK